MSGCSKIPNMKFLSALSSQGNGLPILRDQIAASDLSRDLSDRVTKEILLVTLPHLMKSGHRSIEQNKRTFDSTDKKIRNRHDSKLWLFVCSGQANPFLQIRYLNLQCV